jgi:hypothetical protein
VRRVVDKLLHAPTVRIKQLASAPGGDSYAEALRELFELDQTAVNAVATARDLSVIPSGFHTGAHGHRAGQPIGFPSASVLEYATHNEHATPSPVAAPWAAWPETVRAAAACDV